MSGTLTATFYYLFEETALDVDNLTKPIHDAIRGLVLNDDAQIADLVVRRRRLAMDLRVERSTPTLAEAFDRGGRVPLRSPRAPGRSGGAPVTPSGEPSNVSRIADEYRSRGYTVHVEPRGHLLPRFLAGLLPDLIASKPGDNVVVKLKHGHAQAWGEKLRPFAERVAAQPGWRFTLIVEPERGEPNLTAGFAPPIPLDEIRDRLQRARDLARGSQHDAAFLLAWTSLEASLRRIAERATLPIGNFSLTALIRELQSSGEIDGSQYDRAMEALATRNALVHGLAGPVGEERVRALDALARELVEDLSTAA